MVSAYLGQQSRRLSCRIFLAVDYLSLARRREPHVWCARSLSDVRRLRLRLRGRGAVGPAARTPRQDSDACTFCKPPLSVLLCAVLSTRTRPIGYTLTQLYSSAQCRFSATCAREAKGADSLGFAQLNLDVPGHARHQLGQAAQPVGRHLIEQLGQHTTNLHSPPWPWTLP